MGHIKYSLPNTWPQRLLCEYLYYYLHGLDRALSCAGVYGHAKRISIAAGELLPDFYNSDLFLDNLEASAKDNADIRVLFGPALYVQADRFLGMALEYGNIRLFSRQEREDSHLKVIRDAEDRRFAFVDAPHGVLHGERDSVLLSNDLWDVIDVLGEGFEERLGNAEEIEKPSLVQRFADDREYSGKRGGMWRGFISNARPGAPLATDEEIRWLRESLQEGHYPARL
jgi:hypothetical protein